MKIAVVASGWHFPLHFFKSIAAQQLPTGWSHDLFCVAHREPKYSAEEKGAIVSNLGWSYREVLDKILYEKVATVEDMEALGWKYMLEPNTVGGWGNTNQWLEKYDYKQYDMLLATHDDNLILTDRLYLDLLVPEGDWLITTNSAGSDPLSRREKLKRLFMPWKKPVAMRGSFEFIKPQVLDMLGGRFDLGPTTLNREGQVHATRDQMLLRDWNDMVRPLKRLLAEKGMKHKVKRLSPYLRMSEYCLEGQRGFVSMSQRGQRERENKGLALVQEKFENRMGPDWRGLVGKEED